jgi:hypothetical protein
VLKIHHNLVAKAWQRAAAAASVRALHAVGRPGLRDKAADVIGLYLNPPDHAAVFAVDEENGDSGVSIASIRCCRCRPGGRAARFEYYRHGTLSLLAALDTQSARCSGRRAPAYERGVCRIPGRHRRHAAEAAGDSRHRRQPLDHKTKPCGTFLLEHPHVHLHFTPTYSSWLNQVELWFAKIERDLLGRGVFTRSRTSPEDSVATSALQQTAEAGPVELSQPAHRISSTSVSTVH